MSQEVSTIALLEGSVLHLLNVGSRCKAQKLSLTHWNIIVKSLIHIILSSQQVNTKNKRSKHTRFPHQQMLCHCLWWQWRQCCRQPQSCPGPGPPPSSAHHTERWAPWVGSTGWSPRYSSHLVFPPRCTHTDRLRKGRIPAFNTISVLYDTEVLCMVYQPFHKCNTSKNTEPV